MTQLHKTLQRCRNNSGLSRNQVAEALFIRVGLYRKYELGEEAMPTKVWEDAKKILGYVEIKPSPPSVPVPVLSVKYIPCARPDTSPMKHLKILTKVTSFCEALGQLEAHRKEMHEALDKIESTLAPERVGIMREYIDESCAAHAETLKALT